MRRALVLIAAAAACIVAGGLLLGVTEHLTAGNGLYCGLGTATTVGCSPGIPVAARIVSIALMLTAIPLFAAAAGSIMSAHLRKHMDLHRRATVAQIRNDLDAVKQHTRKTVGDATRSLHRRLDDHADLIAALAGAQAGTSADEPPDADPPLGGERIVPPAAAPHQAGGM